MTIIYRILNHHVKPAVIDASGKYHLKNDLKPIR